MKRQFRLTALATALASVLELAHAAPASQQDVTAQPWRNATQTPDVRANELLAAMTFEQKISLVSAVDAQEYASLAQLGIPALTRVDASSGLRGERGQTAFPVPLALAATFDTGLANEYGKAIAVEARGKGWNVLLGPTVDIARDPRTGRLTEAYGEEPLVSGAIAVSVVRGMQSQNVMAMAKHYTAYQTERDRLSMNINVAPRVVQEVYSYPFYELIDKAAIASIMGSYPKINGKFALENKEIIDLVKADGGFKGYMATDFLGGADGVAQFNAGVDSWSLQPFLRKPDAFRDGRISRARLDDAVRRTLWALFSTGLFDRPVATTPDAVVSIAEHQALARRTAEESIVLLKNEGGLLPLRHQGSVALIGPAGRDVVTGVMWSSYVDPGQFVTPIDAIGETAGKGVKVVYAQGSVGDFTLPAFGIGHGPFDPPVGLKAPDGSDGWQAEFFSAPDFSGQPTPPEVVKAIDLLDKPLKSLPNAWSARWTTRFTPSADGLVRLAASLCGTVKVRIDGRVVIDGMRSTATNFPGAGPYTYPLQGIADLKAGKPVTITVEYSTTGGLFGQRIQLGWQPASMIPDAVKAARQADVAVVFVNQVTGEEMDRDSLDLPGDQNELIAAVSAANPNTVVVLNTGGPVKMPWLSKVKSVLQMWYPGAASGTGIASVLYGDAEPGGRLPVTFPADESQGPAAYKGGLNIDYAEGVFVGYRWYQKHDQKPLFPFGFGLSYSTFGLDRLFVRPLGAGEVDTSVSVHVVNNGKRSGSTVVQVYGGPLPAAIETPTKLLGFAKVNLAPGEAQTVSIPIARRIVSYWDEATKHWVTPAGAVPISVGFSSGDAALKGSLAVK